MRPTLVLIDLQNDFLDRPGLVPERSKVVTSVAELLDGFRNSNVPVLHVHTLIDTDGSNRMPHWLEKDLHLCVEGTPGAATPAELSPNTNETIFTKTGYSAFENPDFVAELTKSGADTLVLGGIYTHACVRQTALDGHVRGFKILIAADAIASTDPLHAELTLKYLSERSIPSLTFNTLHSMFTSHRPDLLPTQGRHWELRNPACCEEVLDEVAIYSVDQVHASVQSMQRNRRSWQAQTFEDRATVLSDWRQRLEERRSEIVAMLVSDIGKPVSYAEGEFDYALKLLTATISTLAEQAIEGEGFNVCHEPVGAVGLITPWNNPLAIPIGKLAPALAWGNGGDLETGFAWFSNSEGAL